MYELVNFANIIAIFGLFLVMLYWLHAFVILYHLIRFGVGSRPKQAALFFFGGSFILFTGLILASLPIILFPN